MENVFKIKGMSCQHCVKTVTKIIEQLGDTRNITVSLERGEARFESSAPVDVELLKKELRKAGYELQ